jgi:Resolvase, N terminal domain
VICGRLSYTEISTTLTDVIQEQDLAPQLDALRAAGCDKVYEEKASGAQRERPKLKAALGYMRPQGKRMRSASIKRAVQVTALGSLCAAKQDLEPRSEPGFPPVENGQTGPSAPEIEAPDLMRLP